MLDEETPNTPNGVGTLNSELEGSPLAKVRSNPQTSKQFLSASLAECMWKRNKSVPLHHRSDDCSIIDILLVTIYW